jgi:hypothetical protein
MPVYLEDLEEVLSQEDPEEEQLTSIDELAEEDESAFLEIDETDNTEIDTLVEAAENKLRQALTLKLIKQHVRKFGITKELLHLYKGESIQYCGESDTSNQMVIAINLDNTVPGVFVEDLTEQIKQATVISNRFYLKLIDILDDMVERYEVRHKSLSKGLEKIENIILPNIDADKQSTTFHNATAVVYDVKVFEEYVKAIQGYKVPDVSTVTSKQLNTILNKLGYECIEKGVYWKIKRKVPVDKLRLRQRGKVGELGWSIPKIRSKLPTMKNLLSTVINTTEVVSKLKQAEKASHSQLNTSETGILDARILRNKAAALTITHKLVMQQTARIIRNYIVVANKLA